MTRASTAGQLRAPLAVTMGDPSGIGIELALRAWERRGERALQPFLFFADLEAVRNRAEVFGLDIPIVGVETPQDAVQRFAEALPVMHVPLQVPAAPGQPEVANAVAVVGAIDQAVAAVRSGDASALVTCPIAKNVLYEAGFKYPGHTEYLGYLAQRDDDGAPCHPVMMLVCDELRVVPLTVHVPLAEVARLVTRQRIEETLRITAEALRRDFGIAQPRIAVAGLNPHAGEAGTLGREEEDIIGPALRNWPPADAVVSGPHPADTLFHAKARVTYDAAIAMYHDQALIPLKTLAFETGVNVTLGLPFVRTSPDHGTAFDIAAKGQANPSSLLAAMGLAGSMAAARQRATAT